MGTGTVLSVGDGDVESCKQCSGLDLPWHSNTVLGCEIHIKGGRIAPLLYCFHGHSCSSFDFIY